MENTTLWKIRVKAFLVQAGVGLGVVVLGFLGSEGFRALVIEHFGTGFVTSSIVLFLTGLVSHVSNRLALKKLGARTGDSDVIII
ncbi:MAG: hypothetical protein U1C12_01650 [Patescibacteria group bacterium]|nr:hypothetical protein [Patescibacteria group bacterium]